jgi:hypothetical protein
MTILDSTNGVNRFIIGNTGSINIPGNLDVGASVDVTGNITVSGTVDGRDIATDVAANTAKTSNATHTGEVTGGTALTIADNVVDEANLKVSNSPTNGYFLSAQSGNTGGRTWAQVATPDADRITEGNSYAEILDTGSNGIFRFLPEGNEVFRIDTNGNVGIGYDSPAHDLHIRKNSFVDIVVENIANNGEAAFNLKGKTSGGVVRTFYVKIRFWR